MKFLRFIISLFLIYGVSFHLVKGQANANTNEKSDCTKLFNFLKGDSQDYANNCCVENKGITCDNDGYIKSFQNTDDITVPDLSSFPYLSKIETLDLNILNLKEIPNSILKLTSLTSLNFSINQIEVIPSDIKNLSKLTRFIIGDNKINVLPNELFTLTNLKELNLGGNNIEVIPSDIQNLSNNLELLYLNHNNIKKLPNEIFNLTHLKKLYLLNNPNLDAKIIRFGDSTIGECEFNTMNVLCYEPYTCDRIHFNNRDFTDVNAEKYFKICTRDEINEIIGHNASNTDTTNINSNNNNNNSNQNDKESSSSFLVIGGIILGCVVGILIGVLVAFMLIKKRKSKKHDNSDFNSNDEFRTGSIKVVINDKQKNNINNNVNARTDNNNNNNNNSDNNDSNDNNSNSNNIINNNSKDTINDNNNNNIQNNLNQTNLNQINLNQNNLNQSNLNPSIIINTTGYNSNTLPGMVLLINNPQNPGNYVMSSMPVLTSNNQINKFESLDMLESSLTGDKKKVALLSKSLDERDEPPPEYTEISKEISKSEAKLQFM